MIPVRASMRTRTNFLVLLAGLLCAPAVSAQAPPLAGLAHMAFRVSDLEKSRDFYGRLGLEQAFEFADAGPTTVAFLKINDRQFIELYARKDNSQELGLMHLCFEADDIAAVHDAYTKRQLNPSEVKKARAGNLLFVLHDPEGQLLEYTQYLPGSLHSLDRGKHLGGRRISDHLLGGTTLVRDTTAERVFYTTKLGFESASSTEAQLRLPGDSEEEVELESTAPTAKPRITLSVEDGKRAAKELRRRGFAVQRSPESVSVTDPDGVLIVFRQARKKKQH
jgi:catechol 2,3-dioxygenase-like lactoylglutathione lyase family enzyme